MAAETPATDATRVRLDTTLGVMTVELDAEKAPLTVKNFLRYVDDGHYDGTLFHRVMLGFMIQGGGFDVDFNPKDTRDSIQNEADNGLKNTRGTLAMARTQDPHSASSQFFINSVDNAFLDHTSKDSQGWGYAVFGQVVEGIEVVDAISQEQTGTQGPHSDVPQNPILIIKAERLP